MKKKTVRYKISKTIFCGTSRTVFWETRKSVICEISKTVTLETRKTVICKPGFVKQEKLHLVKRKRLLFVK